MKRFYSTILLSFLLFSGLRSSGQISLSNGSPSATQNFDGMGATTTLPTNWRMHASTSSPSWGSASGSVTQQASSGTPTAGGTYNWGTSGTERSAGAMTSGSFASPNNLLSFFTNGGTSDITDLTIAYDAERYRVNTAAASIQFFYSLNGSTWTAVTAGDIATSSFPTGTSSYTFASPLTVSKTGITISGLSIAPSSNFYLRWNINTVGSNSQGIGIDNFSITAIFASGCTPPGAQASFTSFSNVGTTQMDVAFGAGTGGTGRLVVMKSGSAIAGTPVNNTTYAGYSTDFSATTQTIAANEKVVYKGTTSPQTITGLTAETQYFIKIFEHNSDCYLTTGTGNTGSRYTLSTEPTAQPGSGLSSTTCTASSIDVTVPAPANGADGYLVIYNSSGGASTGLPADGQSYSAGATFGDATVGAIVTSASTITISSLSPSTSYTFKLVPYNANAGAVAETYNYLTSGTLLSTTYSTLAAAASTASLVTTDATYGYTSNIAYANYQSTPVPSSAAQSVGVHNIIIQDGNGVSNDADALPTLLSAISFTYTGTANTIRAAALFTTSNSLVATATSVGANSITFSGLSGANVTASDNGSTELILRVTFTTTVTDNEKLVFTVSSVTGGNTCSYSQFSSSNGGGAFSDNTGDDDNRIEVTADRIRFTTQPTDQSTNTNLATFTIKAVDANLNTDLDANKSVALTTSGTGMTSSSPYSLTNGVLNISNVQFNTAQTGITLTATTTGYTDNDDVSASFNITEIVYVNGDYRTTGSGNWVSNNASPAIWERMVSGVWTTSNSPAYATANNVYIRDGHTITSGGSFANSVNIKIMDGGIFNCNHSATTASIYIYGGGTLNVNAALTNNGDFEVEDNGTVTINHQYGDGSATVPALWNGTEIFHPASNLIFYNYDCQDDNLIPNNTSISTNTYNGYTAVFGNIILDFGTNLGASDDWIMLASGTNINIAHGDLVFRSNAAANGADMRISTTGTVTSGIGGNFHVEDTYIGNVNINFKTSGTSVFTIKGDMILEGANVRGLPTSNAGASSTINIEGNLEIAASAVFDFNSTVVGSGSPLPSATINLKGDLTVAASGLLNNGNSGYNGILNFTGTGDGLYDSTTQTIDIASTSANENRYVNFFVKNGAYVKLINRDFELGTNDTLTVENGGVLDFGFNGTTPLLVKISGSQTGTTFRSLQGSTLKITSTDGITTTSGTGAGIGNVQTIATQRFYDQVATFHYIGKANQVTGNGITTGSSAKIIICELTDNNTQLSFTNSTGITSTTTISPTGGKLDIRKGQVIESTTAYITGSTGTLYMSQGTLYYIPRGSSSAAASNADLIPRIAGSDAGGTNPYILTGGTIELAGSGSHAFQTLRGSLNRPNYINIKYSGANTYLTDYKNLSTQTNIDSSLILTGTTVVDCIGSSLTAQSFIGNGGLVMSGTSRLRIKKLNTSNPELDGNNVAYSLTGGTVEFYGTSSTQQQQIRGNYRTSSPIKISYYNIDINAAASNYDTSSNSAAGNVDMSSSFLLKNALTVYSPAVFRMDEQEFIDDAASPTNSISVNSGAGLLYGNQNGIKSSGTGVNDGNIRISGTRTLSTGAGYGFVGPNDMVSGSGLPATVAGLYVYKSNIQKIVTLTNSVSATNSLNFYRGIVNTSANTLTVANGSLTAITGYDPPFTAGSGVPFYIDDRYVIGNLERNITTTGVYVFPVGDVVSGEAYNPLRFQASSGSGMATARFIPGDPGSCVAGPVFFTCGAEQRGYNYTDMTTEGRWRMTSSTGTTFNYDIHLHPNIKNLNTTPNVWIDSMGTNYLIDYRALKSPNGTTDWSSYAGIGDLCVSSYYYNIEGAGFSGFSDFAPAGGNTNTNSALPVELVAYSGQCNDNGTATLNWSTASELNSKEYIIEQSADGIQFAPLHLVPAAGNSNSLLHYTATVATSGRTYFRLMMVDTDNSFEYSNTILVSCNSGNENMSVYYTPGSGIVLQSWAASGSDYSIALHDAAGKLVWNGSQYVGSGNNQYLLNPGRTLAAGVYFIRATNGVKTYSRKLWIY